MKSFKAHFFMFFILGSVYLNAQVLTDSVCKEYYLCDVKLNQSCINYQVGDISFKTLNDSNFAVLMYCPDNINGNYFATDTMRFSPNTKGKIIEQQIGIYKPGFYLLKIVSSKKEILCEQKFTFDFCAKVDFKKEVYMHESNLKLKNHSNITDFYFSLFNKQGLEVFKTNNVNFSWDYTYFGKQISAGEYYYSIEYNTISIIESEFKSDAGILKINP